MTANTLTTPTAAGLISADGRFLSRAVGTTFVWDTFEPNLDNQEQDRLELVNALLAAGGAASLHGMPVYASTSITVNKRLGDQLYTLLYNVPTTRVEIRLGANVVTGTPFHVKTY